MYIKITHGWVEQTYDDNGKCVRQSFTPLESANVERRVHYEEDGETYYDDELLIEDAAELAKIEQKEKHWPFDMIQPWG